MSRMYIITNTYVVNGIVAIPELTITDCAAHRNLILVCHKGLYFLVPHEIVQNTASVLHRKMNPGDQLNNPPYPVIKLEQCIPIPSETAKILLEL